MSIKSITLGGGCFWCLEAVFDRLEGVVDVVSGYSNGHTLNPTYEAVCSGQTGHVEVVQLRYDSSNTAAITSKTISAIIPIPIFFSFNNRFIFSLPRI